MPGGGLNDVGEGYSSGVALVYVFNLIVGTGALTLPAAFHDAGWGLSSVIIILLAFMSYLTATFVIESMAAANAMVHWKRLQTLKRPGGRTSSSSSSLTQMAPKPIEVGTMYSCKRI